MNKLVGGCFSSADCAVPIEHVPASLALLSGTASCTGTPRSAPRAPRSTGSAHGSPRVAMSERMARVQEMLAQTDETLATVRAIKSVSNMGTPAASNTPLGSHAASPRSLATPGAGGTPAPSTPRTPATPASPLTPTTAQTPTPFAHAHVLPRPGVGTGPGSVPAAAAHQLSRLSLGVSAGLDARSMTHSSAGGAWGGVVAEPVGSPRSSYTHLSGAFAHSISSCHSSFTRSKPLPPAPQFTPVATLRVPPGSSSGDVCKDGHCSTPPGDVHMLTADGLVPAHPPSSASASLLHHHTQLHLQAGSSGLISAHSAPGPLPIEPPSPSSCTTARGSAHALGPSSAAMVPEPSSSHSVSTSERVTGGVAHSTSTRSSLAGIYPAFLPANNSAQSSSSGVNTTGVSPAPSPPPRHTISHSSSLGGGPPSSAPHPFFTLSSQLSASSTSHLPSSLRGSPAQSASPRHSDAGPASDDVAARAHVTLTPINTGTKPRHHLGGTNEAAGSEHNAGSPAAGDLQHWGDHDQGRGVSLSAPVTARAVRSEGGQAQQRDFQEVMGNMERMLAVMEQMQRAKKVRNAGSHLPSVPSRFAQQADSPPSTDGQKQLLSSCQDVGDPLAVSSRQDLNTARQAQQYSRRHTAEDPGSPHVVLQMNELARMTDTAAT